MMSLMTHRQLQRVWTLTSSRHTHTLWVLPMQVNMHPHPLIRVNAHTIQVPPFAHTRAYTHTHALNHSNPQTHMPTHVESHGCTPMHPHTLAHALSAHLSSFPCAVKGGKLLGLARAIGLAADEPACQ